MGREIDWEKYVNKGDDTYTCRDCGSEIMAGKITHPLWVRGVMGGPGEVHNCKVPYCPKCEPELEWVSGGPLYLGDEHECPSDPRLSEEANNDRCHTKVK